MAWKDFRIILITGMAIIFGAVFTSAGMAEEAPLSVVKHSKTTARVVLNNDVPVRGVQFTVEAVKVTEVRTTERTAGFLAKFNEKNGMVLMVSASTDVINPGKGPIADIICDKPGDARLSEIKIVAVKDAVKDENKPVKKNIKIKKVKEKKKK